MELKNQIKLAQHIQRLLKVSFVDFPIGRTNKGNLNLKFTDNGDFEMFLDSVPLTTKDIFNDENNIELKRMIEKYWFEKENIGFKFTKQLKANVQSADVEMVTVHSSNLIPEAPKSKGRPKGSKNKPKEKEAVNG